MQDTVVAIMKAGDQLVITNIKSSEYPDFTFSVDPSQACTISDRRLTFLAAPLNSQRSSA